MTTEANTDMNVGGIWMCDEDDMAKVMRILQTQTFDRSMQIDDTAGVSSGVTPANVIKVHGPLFPREDALTRFFGIATYEGINRQLAEAKANLGEGAEVWLDIDSGGGSGSLLFECCENIRNSGLRVNAYISGKAASAAYVIAGACDKRVMQEATEVGCLGVMTRYLPEEAKPKNLILSRLATNKVPDKDDVQTGADKLEDIMYRKLWNWIGDESVSYDIDKVASQWGNGRMFFAEDAEERGLTNEVVSVSPYQLRTTQEGESMPNYTEKQLADKLTEQETSLQATFDSQLSTKINDGVKAGVKEITDRYDHLLATDAGASNPVEASRFAKDTRFTLEEAEELLVKMSAAAPAASGTDADETDPLGDAIKKNGGAADLSTLKDDNDKAGSNQKKVDDKTPIVEPKAKYGSRVMDNYKLATGEYEGGMDAYLELWSAYDEQQEAEGESN